jgi:hypothetical protein
LTDCGAFYWKEDGRIFTAVVAIYLVATWWYAIPFGVVWDDWVLLAHSTASFLSVASEAGRIEQGYWILPFQVAKEPWTWALTNWLCLGGSTGLIFLTALRIRRVSRNGAFWIAALTAAVPFYQARFTLSVLPYAVSALCFTAALFLISIHLRRPALSLRLGALLLLLLACSTSSFLTLCWIPPALIAWNAFVGECDAGANVKRSMILAARAALTHAEFIVVPVISFFVRRWLFPAHGLYASYNQLKISPIVALQETLSELWSQISDWKLISSVFLPNPDLATILEAVLPAGCISILCYLAARSFSLTPDAHNSPRKPVRVRLLLLSLGVITPILALYPYIVVQQPPRFIGLWDTRHQLTLMLVTGAALVCIFRSISGQRPSSVIATIVLFLFLTLDYAAGRQFLVDRLEQREFERKLAADPLPPQSLVLMIERDREFRMFGRFFAFYELSHLANRIDGDDDRLVVSNREIIDPGTDTYAVGINPRVVEKMLQFCRYRDRPEFGFSAFSYHGNAIEESVSPQTGRITLTEAIYLTMFGQQTDWIRLDRKVLTIDSSGCPVQR